MLETDEGEGLVEVVMNDNTVDWTRLKEQN
jgi:hypothetical protein